METTKTASDLDILVDNAMIYYGTFGDEQLKDLPELIKTLGDKELGVIQDTLKFEAKPVIQDIKHAGSNGNKEAGWQRLIGWTTKIDTTILNTSDGVFQASLLEKDEATGKFKPIKAGLIPTSFYKDLLIIGDNLKDGSPVGICVKSTYNTGGLQIEFKDKNENGVKMTFEGHSKGSDTPFIIL